MSKKITTDNIFFQTNWCKILRQVNATLLHLVPKVINPSTVSDFRPIDCCNVLYKVINKLLTKRLQLVVPLIVDEAQSAFLKGRSIIDNVLWSHELVRGYDRSKISPRCVIKVDIKKAYDSLSWYFPEEMLFYLNFPSKFIKFIVVCIQMVKYSGVVDGEVYGFLMEKEV